MIPSRPIILHAPSTPPSNLTVSQLSDTQLRLSWTRGNGLQILIVGKLSTGAKFNPIGNTTYTPSSIFGTGSDLGSGNYVLYKGTETSFLLTGLTASTDYKFYAYEFNGYDGSEKFNFTEVTVSTTTLTPQVAPDTQATNLSVVGFNNLDLTRGNGLHVLILGNEGGAINGSFLPVDDVTYSVGDLLGGGNVVVGISDASRIVLSEPSYGITWALRAFEYNVASGTPKYNTNTATDNPITHVIGAEEIWYSPKWAISQSRRDIEHPETSSYMASKNYSGSYIELGGRRLLYVVADNQNDVPHGSDWDQVFLKVQDILDDPLDENTWSWHAVDGGGDPVPVLAIGYLEETTIRQNITSVTNNGGVARLNFTGSNGLVSLGKTIRVTGTTSYNGDAVLSAYSNSGGAYWIELTGVAYVSNETGQAVQVESSIQNWLGTPAINGDGDIISYRSVNVGNNATKYNMGKTLLSSDGETLTRQAPFTKRQDGSHNYYQYCQSYYDSDLDEIIIMVPNGGFGTESRWASTDVYISTDGALGETLTLLASDIFNGTQFDEAGFGLHGPLWKESGRYHWFTVDTQVDNYLTSPTDSKPIYPYLNNRLVEVSCDINFTESPILEKVIYQSSGIAEVGLFPGSAKFSFGGNDHIICNMFRWRVEGGTSAFYQVTLDVKVLCNYQPSGTLVGRDVYHLGLYRFYLPNVQVENDNIGGAPAGREIITNTAITNVDSPTQYGINKVNYSGGYQTCALTGYNNQHLAGKISFNESIILDNQDRGLITKDAVFKMSLYQGKFPQVELTGSNGNVKLYRYTASALSVLTCTLYDTSDFWFTANINGSDIELVMGIDYTILTPTKVIDQVFTQIADNANDLVFGRVSGMSNYTKEIRSFQVWSGSGYATSDNMIKEAIS